MRIVLFCENKYAIDILYPIYQEALKSEDNQLLWYIHLPKIPVFPLQKEVTYTHSMQEVYDFSDEDIQKALFNAGAIGYLAMQYCSILFAWSEGAGVSRICCREERSLGDPPVF